MKVWMSTGDFGRTLAVNLHTKRPRPDQWSLYSETYSGFGSWEELIVCRKIIRKLLYNKRAQLPKHGSKEIMSLEITAKVVKT
jgi:hypothetical protein